MMQWHQRMTASQGTKTLHSGTDLPQISEPWPSPFLAQGPAHLATAAAAKAEVSTCGYAPTTNETPNEAGERQSFSQTQRHQSWLYGI